MMKFKCINDWINPIYSKGNIYEGDYHYLSNDTLVVIFRDNYKVCFYENNNLNYPYQWKLSDYFIPLEDYRSDQIIKILK